MISDSARGIALWIIVSGALTLFAVFIYSGLKPAELLIRRILDGLRRPSPASQSA